LLIRFGDKKNIENYMFFIVLKSRAVRNSKTLAERRGGVEEGKTTFIDE